MAQRFLDVHNVLVREGEVATPTRTRLQTGGQEMLRWLPAMQESQNSAIGVRIPHNRRRRQ